MRLSLQVQYAICGCFDLAYNGRGEPIQIRVIGERQGIPPRYLEQIFQRLRRARLVESKRGPGGGYPLARPSTEITLREIVEAVETPARRPRARGAREPLSAYRPTFLWPKLTERMAQVLEATTLESVCREAAAAAVRRADPQHMYFI